MLVLTRRPEGTILINNGKDFIKIKILEIKDKEVMISIDSKDQKSIRLLPKPQ
jgi:sRNA-binding carbon storage regulator CsrA